ncbi:MAG: ADP-ribosylglycohydrolase family protein [Anaerolineae bacterium]|jgi:ADP-ribosylglycohydrolase|nr:ADP-ribosylglycohydrolase family protein [Anaerolineae bacterium]
MYGAIIGDIIGSSYEMADPPIKTIDFELFTDKSTYTDDTVLTTAIAEAVINQWDYLGAMHKYGRNHPGRGYNGRFQRWLFTDPPKSYESYGNDCAMRAVPIGFAYGSIESVMREAERSALPTHNHPEGIKGAQAVALATYLAGMDYTKEDIRKQIADRFGYDMQRTCDEIRPNYRFDVSCQGTVPEAIIAFLDSEDWESAVRLSISLGGNTDTMACITGGIAQAFYGQIPLWIKDEAWKRLTPPFQRVIEEFNEVFGVKM